MAICMKCGHRNNGDAHRRACWGSPYDGQRDARSFTFTQQGLKALSGCEGRWPESSCRETWPRSRFAWCRRCLGGN